ncbi:hypothetical protein [Natronococcus sp.]|uniref:hypothetical protein n=1 Tax=Natronococcus sp. TaxID=35747 RepID=UPI003A4E05E0
MTSELACPDCETTIESKDQLEEGDEVSEIEFDGENLRLYRNRNLLHCKNCKRPLGIPKQ